MRRRRLWWIPVAMVIVTLGVAFWPHHDGFEFLRELGPVASDQKSIALFGAESKRRYLWLFRQEDAARVKAAMKKHFRDELGFAVEEHPGSLLFTSPERVTAAHWTYTGTETLGFAAPGIRVGDLVVEAYRPESWLEVKLAALPRLLGRE